MKKNKKNVKNALKRFNVNQVQVFDSLVQTLTCYHGHCIQQCQGLSFSIPNISIIIFFFQLFNTDILTFKYIVSFKWKHGIILWHIYRVKPWNNDTTREYYTTMKEVGVQLIQLTSHTLPQSLIVVWKVTVAWKYFFLSFWW